MSGNGGNAYACIESQSNDRASTFHAWGSGKGDTNIGALLFFLVANRSKTGEPAKSRTLCASWGCRDHSVEMALSALDKASARTFNFPGKCFTDSEILFLLQNRRTWVAASNKECDLVPPSFFKYARTEALSVERSTWDPTKLFRNSNKALSTAHISRRLMCANFSWCDQGPLAVRSSRCAPQPQWLASVNKFKGGGGG